MVKIYFFIPKDDLPNEIPTGMKEAEINAYLQPLGTPTNRGTTYNWTLQTYLRLQAEGFPCHLTSEIPEEGIVLAFRGSLPFNLKPTSRVLIVCLLADCVYPHPWSQLHVVQNYRQTLTIKDSYYMPHWSQPSLIPRDSIRGDRFENIAYFGDVANLAPELIEESWSKQIDLIGLNWCVMPPQSWNDYSNTDAVIAVRSFDGQDYIYKPASKLFNAWRANVPAILGRESAYQAERKSELDYIEVVSPDEIISALKRLRDDKKLRQDIIYNGQIRAQEISFTNLTARWRDLIIEKLVPAYESWCTASNLTRKFFFTQRYLSIKMNGIKQRLDLRKFS